MSDVARAEVAAAIVRLVETDLRWQLRTARGTVRSDTPADALASRELRMATMAIAVLVDPARPERFLARLRRVRARVRQDLDPLGLRGLPQHPADSQLLPRTGGVAG